MGKDKEFVLRTADASFVSVVIRCRNAAADLDACLRAINTQRLPAGLQLEIIVVDNDSSDATASVARSHNATVLPISTAEFTWGRALNRGIAASRGEHVILLSADAHPADERWLGAMLSPFEDANLAVVYGRQIPRRDAPIGERVRLFKTFKTVSKAYQKGDDEILPTGDVAVASNSCAAIRRSVWETLPYDEEVLASEDRIWTAAVISNGLTVYYQADAQVYHSHKDSVRRYVWRQWEFYERSRKDAGRKVSTFSVLRTCAGMVKRRVRNCFAIRQHFMIKLVALGRLPLETFLFMMIGILCRNDNLRRKVRPLFWG